MRKFCRPLINRNLSLVTVALVLAGCGEREDVSEVSAELPEAFEVNPLVEKTVTDNISKVRETLPAESYVNMSFLPADGVYRAPSDPGPNVKLTVGLPWIFNDQHAPLYIADALGYFAEEGIEVDLREGGPGRNPLALLAGGSVDIAISSGGAAVVRLAVSKTGADVVAIGAMNRGSGYSWLAMDEDTPPDQSSRKVLTPADFDGAKIGIQEGAAMQMTYFLENFPYLKDKVTFMRSGFTPDPLVVGAIDFYAAMYENQPRLIEGLGFNNWTAFRFSDYGLMDFTNVHVVSRETAETQGPMLRRYLRAVGRAIQLMLDDPSRAAEITQGYSTTTQLSKQQILRRFDLQRSMVKPSPGMPILYAPEAMWDRVASQLFTYNEIEL